MLNKGASIFRLRKTTECERYMWNGKEWWAHFSFSLWMGLITVTLLHSLPGKKWFTFLLCSMCLPWVNAIKGIVRLTAPWRPDSSLWAVTGLWSTKIKLNNVEILCDSKGCWKEGTPHALKDAAMPSHNLSWLIFVFPTEAFKCTQPSDTK